MQKKNMETNKGITLIALIITIIVMLILVAVTINIALNGGLFETASTSAKGTEKEGEREELLSAVVASYDALAGTVDGAKLKSNLAGWTVEGSGPFICTSPKGNKFKVTLEGDIEDYVALNLNALEKYILGAEGTGEKFEEIFSLQSFSFINVPEELEEKGGLTPVSYSIVSTEVTSTSEAGINADFYFKYEGKTYKFRALVNGEGTAGTTLAEIGVKEISYDTNSKVGKYVTYDEKDWIVLYDDDVNGLQIISEEALLDNGNEIYLGYNDSSIPEGAVTEDLDGDGDLYIEKAMYSYDNAVETLNEKCESLITNKTAIATDEEGKYKIRSVGSNPTNANNDTVESFIGTADTIPGYGTSTWFEDNLNLQKNTNGDRTYYTIKNTETEYAIKNTDTNYMNDFDRMVVLGINQGIDSNGENLNYWLASRVVYAGSSIVDFSVRCVDGGLGNYNYLWYVYSGYANGKYNSYAVRPVVSLSSGVLDSVEGEGTSASPYILD